MGRVRRGHGVGEGSKAGSGGGPGGGGQEKTAREPGDAAARFGVSVMVICSTSFLLPKEYQEPEGSNHPLQTDHHLRRRVDSGSPTHRADGGDSGVKLKWLRLPAMSTRTSEPRLGRRFPLSPRATVAATRPACIDATTRGRSATECAPLKARTVVRRRLNFSLVGRPSASEDDTQRWLATLAALGIPQRESADSISIGRTQPEPDGPSTRNLQPRRLRHNASVGHTTQRNGGATGVDPAAGSNLPTQTHIETLRHPRLGQGTPSADSPRYGPLPPMQNF